MLSVISDALDNYLQSQLTGNALPVAWEGVAYDPQTNSPYLRVTLAAYSRTPTGPGPNTTFLEVGTYSIVVVWPVGSGKAAALQQADNVKSMFPRGLSLPLASQAPLIVSMTTLQPSINDGDWLNIPVRVNWMTSDEEN